MKTVRLDNAAEFRALGDFLAPYGVQFEYTTAYTPEQNGVSERLNRSLVTIARSMLLDAKLPSKFWGYAILIACYLRNRTPIGPKNLTLEEAYSGRRPDIRHLRAYRCIAYAHIPKENRLKLEPTAKRCIFIGYMPTTRQYRLFHPEQGRIIVSTAPTFAEDKRLTWDWKEEVTGAEINPYDPMEPISRDIESPEIKRAPEPTPEPTPGPTTIPDDDLESTIIVDTGDLGTPENPYMGPKTRSRAEVQALSAEVQPVEKVPIPGTYAKAMNDPIYSAYWKQAISEELTKLQALNTWKYDELPPGKQLLGHTWVFTVKYTPIGLIDRYKARLVAQGFKQVSGDDFLETFSPTIRSESLRILLALGAFEDLEIRQIDVVSAYPRSKLHATVYMKPPKELGAPEGKVLCLERSLYGLKQSGREWYIEACRGLKTLGFSPLFSEPSVFRNPESGIIIGLYVDDMLILGPRLGPI